MAGIFRKLLFICGLLFHLHSTAQGYMRGRVLDRKTDQVVQSATVRNLSKDRLNQSDQGGNYRIYAAVGDLVIFSSAGYISDSVRVTEASLFSPPDIYMERNIVMLKEINLGEWNSYQLDSISRRQEFDDILQKHSVNLVGGRGNRPIDGFGVTFSPISFFSHKERELRKFKKNFPKQEEEAYTSYRFSSNYVETVTGLQGDSLHLFMMRYRPTYQFCRSAGRDDMLLYVNDKYKEFTRPEKPPRKGSRNK
jgi:hypothetical protein